MTGRARARRIAATAVATVTTIVLAGCGGGAAGGSDIATDAGSDGRFDLAGTTIRVGAAQEQALGMGFSYALEILKGWGADVQRESLTNVSGLEALVADRIDIAARSSDELIAGLSTGVDVRTIGAPVSTMHYALIGASNAPDLAALRGKQIAISGPGGFDTLLIRTLLEQRGLNPDRDVTLVPIGGSSERTAALLADQVSAAVVFVDNWFQLQRRSEDLQLIGYIEEILPGLSARAIFAEQPYLEQNPEVATAVACANLEANRWVQESRQEFIDFTTERVRGADAEAVAGFYDAAMEIGLFPTDPERVLNVDSYQATANLMLQQGVIDTPVDARQVVDTSYVQQAASQGCGQGTTS